MQKHIAPARFGSMRAQVPYMEREKHFVRRQNDTAPKSNNVGKSL